MRVPRWLRVLVGLLTAVGLGTGIWFFWATTPTASAPGQEGWVTTKFGPLGPGDRDLLIKVRLAGLWEHPVGQEAMERATQPRTREIAGFISAEHQELDRIVVGVARELGVQLPNQPSEQQQEWMAEISAQSGDDYDLTMVNLLRKAHGNVYPAIGTIRGTTRNDKVRDFAIEAETYVARHMGYLESTGMVNFDDLPEPPTPAQAVVTPTGAYQEVPIRAGAALGLVALGIGLLFLLPMMRENRQQSRGRHRIRKQRR